MGDKLKGTSDSLMSSMQPNVRALAFQPRTHGLPRLVQSEKSTTQQAGDAVSSNSNETQVSLPDICGHECGPYHASQPSMMQKAKNAVGMGDN